MQALYQWHMSGSNLTQIETEFRADYDMRKVDVLYFSELLHRIPARLGEVDAHYRPFLDREQKDIDPIELALLRIGSYELMARIDVPYKVVINEAVSLAKKFGAEDSHKYINGVLDRVAGELRGPEVNAEKG